MRFSLMVTGPAYGTQQASSALQFAHALLAAGHELVSVFFYREGVYNANQFTSPASDEFDLVRAWQTLNETRGVALRCAPRCARRSLREKYFWRRTRRRQKFIAIYFAAAAAKLCEA